MGGVVHEHFTRKVHTVNKKQMERAGRPELSQSNDNAVTSLQRDGA
jgi:hypothetical protein